MAWNNRSGKYNAKKTEVNGILFASKAEAKRYQELALLLKEGHIATLELQPRYKLEINGYHICTYIADFAYRDGRERDAKLIVEDVKGVRTPQYNLKKRLMKAILGIEITEIG